MAAATAYTTTTGCGLVIFNNDSLTNSGSKRIYLKYIRLVNRTIAASATGAPWQTFIFGTDNSNRYSSAGQALTPQNVNADSGVGSIASIHAGAVVLTADSAGRRVLASVTPRGSVQVVSDQILFTFGDVGMPTSVPVAAAAGYMLAGVHPVILGPGQSFTLHQSCPNQSAAPVYDIEVGHFER